MKHALILTAALTIGCYGSNGGSDDDDPGSGSASCSQSDRVGTYLLEYYETSGDCGPIPSTLTRLDGGSGVPDGCSLDAADRWSANDCKLERAYTCNLQTADGTPIVASYVAIAEQQDDDAESIGGIITITVTNSAGAFVCASTYEIAAERQ